jgi:hypothetical protein
MRCLASAFVDDDDKAIMSAAVATHRLSADIPSQKRKRCVSWLLHLRVWFVDTLTGLAPGPPTMHLPQVAAGHYHPHRRVES